MVITDSTYKSSWLTSFLRKSGDKIDILPLTFVRSKFTKQNYQSKLSGKIYPVTVIRSQLLGQCYLVKFYPVTGEVIWSQGIRSQLSGHSYSVNVIWSNFIWSREKLSGRKVSGHLVMSLGLLSVSGLSMLRSSRTLSRLFCVGLSYLSVSWRRSAVVFWFLCSWIFPEVLTRFSINSLWERYSLDLHVGKRILVLSILVKTL